MLTRGTREWAPFSPPIDPPPRPGPFQSTSGHCHCTVDPKPLFLRSRRLETSPWLSLVFLCTEHWAQRCRCIPGAPLFPWSGSIGVNFHFLSLSLEILVKQQVFLQREQLACAVFRISKFILEWRLVFPGKCYYFTASSSSVQLMRGRQPCCRSTGWEDRDKMHLVFPSDQRQLQR